MPFGPAAEDGSGVPSLDIEEMEHQMKLNMGMTDRKIRAFIVAPALVVIAAVAGFGSVGGIIALVLSAVMLATAAVGSCPLYLPLHIDTDRSADKAA